MELLEKLDSGGLYAGVPVGKYPFGMRFSSGELIAYALNEHIADGIPLGKPLHVYLTDDWSIKGFQVCICGPNEGDELAHVHGTAGFHLGTFTQQERIDAMSRDGETVGTDVNAVLGAASADSFSDDDAVLALAAMQRRTDALKAAIALLASNMIPHKMSELRRTTELFEQYIFDGQWR